MNIYIFALACSFLFLISKFILNKYINKKDKPIKPIFKDSIIIFIVVIISKILYTNLFEINANSNEITVFTDTPNF